MAKKAFITLPLDLTTNKYCKLMKRKSIALRVSLPITKKYDGDRFLLIKKLSGQNNLLAS